MDTMEKERKRWRPTTQDSQQRICDVLGRWIEPNQAEVSEQALELRHRAKQSIDRGAVDAVGVFHRNTSVQGILFSICTIMNQEIHLPMSILQLVY